MIGILLLVGQLRIVAKESERFLASDHALIDIGHALGADHPLGDSIGAAVDLAAHAGDPHAVRILELDGEVVVDVAQVAHGPAAHADALHRMGLERPVEDVEIVDVLLDDVVAAGPGEPRPAPALPFHIGAAILVVPLPVAEHVPAVPVALARNNVANLPVVNPPDGLLILLAVPPLRAGDHGELLLLSEFRRLNHRANALGVHAGGLLHEYMLARLDGGLEMLGPPVRRRHQENHLDLGRQHPLVRVEAHEALVRRDLHGGGHVRPELGERLLEPVLEQVAQRHDFHARCAVDTTDEVPCALPAAANQADTNRVRTGRVHPPGDTQRRHGGGRRFDEITTRKPAFVHSDPLWICHL